MSVRISPAASASTSVQPPRASQSSSRTAASLFAAAAKKLAPSTPNSRLSIVVAHAQAAARSPHAAAISECLWETVRNQANKLVAAKGMVTKAQHDAPSEENLFDELQRNFQAQKQDKTPAVAPLSRALKARSRVTEAQRALHGEIDQFLQLVLSTLNEAEARRLREAADWEARLHTAQIEAEREREALKLELQRECAHERSERLKAALRLAGNWRSAVTTGRLEVDALGRLFRSELESIDAAREADYARHTVELQALGRAVETSESETLCMVQQNKNLRETMAMQKAEADKAMSAARLEHEHAIGEVQASLRYETASKKLVQKELHKTTTEFERQLRQVSDERDVWKHYGARADEHLASTTSTLTNQKEELQKTLEARSAAECDRLLQSIRELEGEVHRLRGIVAIAADALPGGEARMLLFYENAKNVGKKECTVQAGATDGGAGSQRQHRRPPMRPPGRAPCCAPRKERGTVIRPKPSISWRGQHEEAVPTPQDPPISVQEARISFVHAAYRRRPESAQYQ